MRQSVVFKLRGALAAAVAVEWTDAVAPEDSADGWQACLRLANGDWQFNSHAAEAGTGTEWRGRGLFPDIALRYRLSPSGTWTLISASRKEIILVAVEASDPRRESLEIPAAALIPPLLLLTPALAGTGKVGSEVVVTPGVWGGVPAPELAVQWCRDGAEIPGATGPVYVPGPADDRVRLTCRVSAASLAGTAQAETAALAITHVAPEPVGVILEEIYRPALGRADHRGERVFPGRGSAPHGDGRRGLGRCPFRGD